MSTGAMSWTKQRTHLLAIFAILFIDVVRSSESAAVYVPCEGGTTRLLELDELVHISDVVMNGVVVSSLTREDEFGTFQSSVSYYYAYKKDRLLYRAGLSSVDVVDFPARPSAESSIFFLIRQPNAALSVYCQSRLSALVKSHETAYSGLFEIVERVREVAAG